MPCSSKIMYSSYPLNNPLCTFCCPSYIKGTLQSNGFWPLQSFSENLRVHRDSNSQSGSSLRSVRVHSLTLSYTPGFMKCDSWASLLARTLASPCFGCEPKARVITCSLFIHGLNHSIFNLRKLGSCFHSTHVI
jgi:hypothetical protein